MLWFMAHLILLYVQRSDQLRMHHKTLQRGDEQLGLGFNSYVQNLTFYAGDTEPGSDAERFIEGASSYSSGEESPYEQF